MVERERPLPTLMALWVSSSVLAPLLPFGVAALFDALDEVVGRGDLLVLDASLFASLVGQLLMSRKADSHAVLLLFCLLDFGACVATYSLATAPLLVALGLLNHEVVLILSWGNLAVASVVGLVVVRACRRPPPVPRGGSATPPHPLPDPASPAGAPQAASNTPPMTHAGAGVTP